MRIDEFDNKQKNIKFHLLFEQSGVFKNILRKYGYIAYDYDILNDYNQTDFQVDLFNEIEKEYLNISIGCSFVTIFTNLTAENDFIIAFFPCTHFCDANQLQYKLWSAGKRLPLNLKNLDRLIKRNFNRSRYFELYLKFCFICSHKGIKTIIENPASCGSTNYLKMFSPIDVAYFEKDRSLYGDDFKKPTNYFAINFEMKESSIPLSKNTNLKNIMHISGMSARSFINEKYAENFYLRFLSGV